MKQLLLLLFGILTFTGFSQDKEEKTSLKTVQFLSLDSLPVTAAIYRISKRDAPLIILYHQARYSRGEYIEIAPQLNRLGFNCMAIDQRSGNEVNGIINQTHQAAVKKRLGTEYLDALPDLEAALIYAKKEFPNSKLIIWGSSYSSAFVFYLGSKYQKYIRGIISFSPGNYFSVQGHTIAYFAKNLACPVFITSRKDEQQYWQEIYNSIPSEKVYFIPQKKGKHGSKALWKNNENHQAYWNALLSFLKQLKA